MGNILTGLYPHNTSNKGSHPLGSLLVPCSCGCSSFGKQTRPEWTPQWWSSPPTETTHTYCHFHYDTNKGQTPLQTSAYISQTLRLYRPHHGNYIKGHKVQSTPVARHRGDSFLWESEHDSSQTLTPTDRWQDCRNVTEERVQIKELDLTMVMYQLLTTVSSNRVTRGEEKNTMLLSKVKWTDPGLVLIKSS